MVYPKQEEEQVAQGEGDAMIMVGGTARATNSKAGPTHREALWPDSAIGALLAMFEEFQASCPVSAASSHQMGKTHWGRIAEAVNAACNTSYSGVQCKYKWNRLKKSYTKAKLRGEPWRFIFYKHVERIVRNAFGRRKLHRAAASGKGGVSRRAHHLRLPGPALSLSPPVSVPVPVSGPVAQEEEEEEDEDDEEEADDRRIPHASPSAAAVVADDDVDSTCEGAATNESKPDTSASQSDGGDDEDEEDEEDEDDEEEEDEEEDLGNKRKKVCLSASLTSLGQKIERTMNSFAQTMQDIEKSRTHEMKRLIDAQLEITSLFVNTNRMLKQCDGGGVSRTELMVDTASVHSNPGGNVSLTPPLNFAMVHNGLYRSGFPGAANFSFLKTLRLCSIISLSPEPYPQANLDFLRAEGIHMFQFVIKSYKEPMTTISEGAILDALKVISDIRNHPLLIYSNREATTSCLVGCFRKVQNWCLSSIFEEYRRFAGQETEMSDLQFIENFDTLNLCNMNGYSSFANL